MLMRLIGLCPCFFNRVRLAARASETAGSPNGGARGLVPSRLADENQCRMPTLRVRSRVCR